jgi:acetyltransferase
MHATFTFEPRELTLRDGRAVRIRALLPGDEEEILQAFERLGADSRYMRFMATVREPNVARLRAVLASFPERGFALAATAPAADGIDIVGAASVVLEDERSGEFAMTVVESWAGAGLGRRLLEALVEVARARGLATLRGFVLGRNAPMLALAQRVGFESRRDPDDFNQRIVTLAL